MNEILISPVDNPESIIIDLRDYPVAYQNKIEELKEQGFTDSEIKQFYFKIEVDLCYHKNHGLFLVESEAIDSGDIVSPYDGKSELKEQEI